VRFEDVLHRLEPLPETLPEGPPELMPVVVASGEPRVRPPWDAAAATGSRAAAVLVLLYPGAGGDARLVLTERIDRGGHHSGEVSFPGGRAEPGDSGPVDTALREAAEEVGLDPSAAGVRIVGQLPVHWIPVSNYAVIPVVATAERRPAFVPQPSEVAAILEPRVDAFLPRAPLITVEREIRGVQIRYAAYPIDGLAVWGMTARVLGGLGTWLGRAHPDSGSPEGQ
jgi:8-oxo-dGTP pyrophosphatase MutT (NUDIX family)